MLSVAEFLEKIKENAPYISEERMAKAYELGKKAHALQKRKDGTEYFNHPIAVALILSELGMDEDSLIAALLHDVIEDTDVTSEELTAIFGPEVTMLVEGVTKLTNYNFESKVEKQAENLRKMFIAMSKDFRVILIKLADRLHNMRTLQFMPENKQIDIATETIKVYAPIAHRCGIFMMKWELEDLSFKYLYPEEYQDIVKKVSKKRSEREALINEYIEQLKKAMTEADIECEINGRPKNFYSIYKKMKTQRKEFDELYDLTAIRIIVKDEKKLYAALGVVHSMWNTVPGRFKDYVSMPRNNIYRSLHTTVMGKHEPFEIQIRTPEMHAEAEYGLAAHWRYKEKNYKPQNEIDLKIQWFRHMMEVQNDLQGADEFMDALTNDILIADVYVFTPNAEVVELPEGSTPIDFAYRIHSEVGNNAIGARVDKKAVPLSYQLQSGQIVEIRTSKTSTGPSRDWLKFVKTTQAKQRIRQFFKRERREENIEKGAEIMAQELRRYGIKVKDVMNDVFLEGILRRLSLKSVDDLYNTIGYGGIQTNQVIPKIREKLKEQEDAEQQEVVGTETIVPVSEKPAKHSKQCNPSTGVSVHGIGDVYVRFAKCCTPVPGDDIIGYITRGRGVTVHRADCTNFERNEDTENRFIEVSWCSAESTSYSASIQIIALNTKGIVSDITTAVVSLDIELTGVVAKKSAGDSAVINLNVEIKHKDEFDALFRKLKSVPNVLEVRRMSNQ